MDTNHVVFELHFWVPGHGIRGDTRNRCCGDLIWMIHETATILFPGEEFEILFYPPEQGSYKDILKLAKKNPWAATGILITLWAAIFQGLTYVDSHQDHIRNEQRWALEDIEKCIDLREKLEELRNKWLEVAGISEEDLAKVCGNIKLKKLKNDHWRTLQLDDMIANNEISLLDGKWNTIASDSVQRAEFDGKIEAVIENEEYERENLEWVIELISPVFKQKRAGKGTPWKGVYYGNDIAERWIEILRDWEEISFFMQDGDFKKQIEEGAISFQAWDNLKVTFSIKGSLNGVMLLFQSKAIYITTVNKFNEDLIEHKERLIRKTKLRAIASTGQMSFDQLSSM